ncbi:hypothetical protein KK062_23300 [Fulvivirgaceae bacterium PWU5]|uniref:Uncharacterized protein n=1 Tax=Dawidia cretensis TaxID=2782350 RepID=A0AAP2E1U4_9BACT|nr:hypothetical protein [Dawidia cretensis]MBT1711190.1 hypothetical protein [Dawidia cretensis]
MSLRRPLFALAGVLAIVVASCSVLKKNDPDEAVRAFIVAFQTSLKHADPEIFKLFETQQSHEAILSAIRVLQNKESEYIVCAMAYQNASIEYDEDVVKVTIPTVFTPRNVDDADAREESTLTLLLKQKQHALVITQLEGEEFYRSFSKLRGDIEWQTERKDAMKKRLPIYARAQEIQQQYDSVIWFTRYEDKHYYYVVNGTWEARADEYRSFVKGDPTEYKMGLVDEAGSIVIPVEYEMIGTLGFMKPHLVEVVKDGKAGHFDLTARKLIVEPAYDMLMPYEQEDIHAFTQTDTTYGWIDALFQYHEGFPSIKAEEYVRTFQFLPKDLTLDNQQTLCEIPNEEHAGIGMIIPPTYFVKLGLFEQVITGISTADMPFAGWNGYIKTGGTLLQDVTDGIRALITGITTHYTEGREEFYVSNRVTFITSANDTLGVSEIAGSGVSSLRRIRENIIEVVSTAPEYFAHDSPDEEYDIPIYTYYTLDKTGVTRIKSSREYNFTEFAELDSSYVVGNFHRWDYETETQTPSATLSLPTLQRIHDEILVSYGYRLPDSTTREYFSRYPQEIENLDEIRSKLTDLDRHNVTFLEMFMGLLQESDTKNPI